MHFAANLPILADALLLEAAFGYPKRLFRAIRHPVVWIGAMLGWLDRRLNRESMPRWRRRAHGVLALLAVLCAAILPAIAVQAASLTLWAGRAGFIVPAVLASVLFAQRSLWRHVRAVGDALDRGGLTAGRAAVSQIVGRNPESLDQAGVLRAAIESLAENFSDAVVAPSLWCALFGLPGIAACKAINTADSMLGHRTPRHEAFGWASARLDDLINLPASRLAAGWLILAALLHPRANAGSALGIVWRHARRHRSPNAGWPEAAMAGATGLRLAGPRVYGAVCVEDPWIGTGRQEATIADLRLALSLYRLACGIEIAAVLIAAIIVQG
ncbi:MAG TPA: adenosylcobinamide-phosphate synthase CbiB [Acetobacteraceae bacterium]|nr:adenosylcobinamide-phosphate synthase CbiB [Acetobacteraceae bacterium]